MNWSTFVTNSLLNIACPRDSGFVLTTNLRLARRRRVERAICTAVQHCKPRLRPLNFGRQDPASAASAFRSWPAFRGYRRPRRGYTSCYFSRTTFARRRRRRQSSAILYLGGTTLHNPAGLAAGQPLYVGFSSPGLPNPS